MAVTLQLLFKNLIESFLRKNITHTHTQKYKTNSRMVKGRKEKSFEVNLPWILILR